MFCIKLKTQDQTLLQQCTKSSLNIQFLERKPNRNKLQSFYIFFQFKTSDIGIISCISSDNWRESKNKNKKIH